MADELAKSGLYLDEFNKIRILDSTVSNQTNDLIETSKTFKFSKSSTLDNSDYAI